MCEVIGVIGVVDAVVVMVGCVVVSVVGVVVVIAVGVVMCIAMVTVVGGAGVAVRVDAHAIVVIYRCVVDVTSVAITSRMVCVYVVMRHVGVPFM